MCKMWKTYLKLWIIKKNNVEKFEEQNDRWNIRRFLLDKQKEEQKKQPDQGHPKMEHHTRIHPWTGCF